jgi:hypothetical protein
MEHASSDGAAIHEWRGLGGCEVADRHSFQDRNARMALILQINKEVPIKSDALYNIS